MLIKIETNHDVIEIASTTIINDEGLKFGENQIKVAFLLSFDSQTTLECTIFKVILFVEPAK